jgi:hypothetical protein
VSNEPLLSVGTLTAIATAIIGLLVAFGVNLTGEQQTAVLSVVAVLAPLAVAGIARNYVTPYRGPEHGEHGYVALGGIVGLVLTVLLVLVLLKVLGLL